MDSEITKTFWVNGIVSHRDKKPYVQFSDENGHIAQLSMAQARKIAIDILVMSARTEMDAMILDFLEKELKAGPEAGAAAMYHFREYRAELDQEQVEGRIDK